MARQQNFVFNAIADQIVIGTEQFRGNPANLSFSCKAPEDWRSPRRFAYFNKSRCCPAASGSVALIWRPSPPDTKKLRRNETDSDFHH
jgi:hypothetical protein